MYLHHEKDAPVAETENAAILADAGNIGKGFGKPISDSGNLSLKNFALFVKARAGFMHRAVISVSSMGKLVIGYLRDFFDWPFAERKKAGSSKTPLKRPGLFPLRVFY